MKSIIAVLVVLVGAVAYARPGKVVRVDRTRNKTTKPVALCADQNGEMTCFTGEVARGDELHSVNEDREFRRLEVTGVTRSKHACPGSSTVAAKTRQIEAIPATPRSRFEVFFGGVELLPGVSKMLDKSRFRQNPPRGVPRNTRVELVLDITGNNDADILIAADQCHNRKPSANTRAFRICIQTWRRQRGSVAFRLVDDTAIEICP